MVKLHWVKLKSNKIELLYQIGLQFVSNRDSNQNFIKVLELFPKGRVRQKVRHFDLITRLQWSYIAH